MRTIGLLGGMSSVSTEHYYRLINADVGARLGPEHCASLTLWQSDFAVIAELQRAGRWDDAGEILADGARALVAAGADLVAICANTMHLCAPQTLERSVRSPSSTSSRSYATSACSSASLGSVSSARRTRWNRRSSIRYRWPRRVST